jgi:hypothetical protein
MPLLFYGLSPNAFEPAADISLIFGAFAGDLPRPR